MTDATLDPAERAGPTREDPPAVVPGPGGTPRRRNWVRIALGGLVILCGLVLAEGWLRAAFRRSVRPDREAARQDRGDRPSIAEAKEALLALLQSGGARDLRVSPDELSRRPGRSTGAAGQWSWGPFQIDLPGKTYEYTLVYGTKCAIVNGGRFEVGPGRWVATPYRPPWN